jgi:hypothetical protein
MSFDDDYIRRLLNEQNRVRDLVDQALGGPTIRAIFEAADPFQQLRHQLPSVLGVTEELWSNMRAAIDAASCIRPTAPATDPLIQNLIDEQRMLFERAEATLRPQIDQFALAQQAILPYLEIERLAEQMRLNTAAVASIQSMHESIDQALTFARGIDTNPLFGMNPAELLDRINPLQRHLKELEESLAHLGSVEEADAPDSKLTRAKILAGLDILRLVLFEYVYKIMMLWLALHGSGVINQEQLDRIESAVLQIAEHHQAVEAFHEDIANGSDLSTAITTTQVYLRTGPSQSNDSITLLPAGTQFLVTRQQDDWSAGLATMDNGSQLPGWINSDFLVPAPSAGS